MAGGAFGPDVTSFRLSECFRMIELVIEDVALFLASKASSLRRSEFQRRFMERNEGLAVAVGLQDWWLRGIIRACKYALDTGQKGACSRD